MNTGVHAAMIALFTSSLMCNGCSENGIEPEDIPQTVPLDGRGGGVITYSLQHAGDPDAINEIHAINADGTGDVRIIETSMSLSHPSWSPDGHLLAVTRNFGDTASAIYVFDANGDNPIRLTNTSGVLDGYPSWSPDGSRIAFHRFYLSQNREEIWVMNSNGSDQRWIGIEGGSARWSTDGTRLIYHSHRGDNYDLFACNADGTDEQRLTSTLSGELSPVWAPDGIRVAFTTVESNLTHHVFVMDADGSNLSQVAEGGAPQWSPDGSLLAFHSDGETFVVGVDGTGQLQVTISPPNATSIFPAWRPGFP